MSGLSKRFAATATIVVVAASLSACQPAPLTSHDLELAGPLTNPEMPLPNGAAASLSYITASFCGEAVPCVEAWSSDVGTFIRFASVEDAAEHATEAADAEQDRFVVADFSDVHISDAARTEVIGKLFAQMPQEGGPFSIFGA